MSFSSISVKTNGERILNSFFNDLRTAGIALESGITTTTLMTIANNQVAAANVTSASLTTSYTSGVIHAEIKRGTTVQIVKIYFYYDGTNWYGEYEGKAGSDAGVTFSVTVGGQLQYTSTNTSAGTMKWFWENKIAA